METFWMLVLVRGCVGCDAHVVMAALPVCPSPGLSITWCVGSCKVLEPLLAGGRGELRSQASVLWCLTRGVMLG